jgi:hypothetical protein
MQFFQKGLFRIAQIARRRGSFAIVGASVCKTASEKPCRRSNCMGITYSIG